VRVVAIGHGRRAAKELIALLHEGGAETLVDVRRLPGSRWNPQFNQARLAQTLDDAGISYVHAVDLGGRLSGEPGEERFACIREPAFRSYAARMGRPAWQRALDDALGNPAPAFMCAETAWQSCHRRLIADLLVARGHEVVHLIRPGEAELHRLSTEAEVEEGRLFLCGVAVA
jgi:uncharacterized protein (DUF488 family)